jgi:hypothetical protein
VTSACLHYFVLRLNRCIVTQFCLRGHPRQLCLQGPQLALAMMVGFGPSVEATVRISSIWRTNGATLTHTWCLSLDTRPAVFTVRHQARCFFDTPFVSRVPRGGNSISPCTSPALETPSLSSILYALDHKMSGVAKTNGTAPSNPSEQHTDMSATGTS